MLFCAVKPSLHVGIGTELNALVHAGYGNIHARQDLLRKSKFVEFACGLEGKLSY